MKKIIECVPNISEGRDLPKIQAIASVVETVEGVKLLDIDPGKATNRTVITFAGEPEQVVEAAFRLIKTASEKIDMRKHKGEHPRMGATDVCPLVPVSGIEMEEVVLWAHKLGERVGRELGIPGYYYESAAVVPERKNLAYCRQGEYEGLEAKFASANGKPDFGIANPEIYHRTGAIAIGARQFLVAYNVNLNTTSTRRANAIAFDVRETGRVMREGDPITGRIVTDAQGNPINIPGKLKAVKGIGWFIEEYGIAQISYNLTDISITPMHLAFEESCKSAEQRGLRVTGSELIGLVPLKAMLDAGKYFLKKQERSVGISDEEIIKIAIKSLGLDELKPFIPKERIIEFKLAEDEVSPLIGMDLRRFANETASESPAPGGGSISAYVGSLGASLAAMVANLSAHKRGWDDKWSYFSDWAEKAMNIQKTLLFLVDEDTKAFNRIMEALGLPKSNDAEKQARAMALNDATKYAIEVPLSAMKTAFQAFDVLKSMAEFGNPNSVSDAGVGALCIKAAIHGAFLNVKTNCMGFQDRSFVEGVLKEGEIILNDAKLLETEILEICDRVMMKL